MGMYRKEWSCCNSATETDAWEPQDCPFCAPQPQRTWVRLTDDEVERLAHHELWVKNFIRQVEEKLRGKNT